MQSNTLKLHISDTKVFFFVIKIVVLPESFGPDFDNDRT